MTSAIQSSLIFYSNSYLEPKKIYASFYIIIILKFIFYIVNLVFKVRFQFKCKNNVIRSIKITNRCIRLIKYQNQI